jgi:hypothetical protein
MNKQHLETAYRETRYSIFIEGKPVIVRIDAPLPAEVDHLLQQSKSQTGIIITAWNPRSEPRPVEENRERNRQLLSLLTAQGYQVYEALGEGKDPAWPAEESLFVLDIEKDRADKLAIDYGQNAYVSLAKSQPATLVFSAHWKTHQPG